MAMAVTSASVWLVLVGHGRVVDIMASSCMYCISTYGFTWLGVALCNMVWLPDIFLHLELHGLVQYGEVRYGVACCCVV